MYYNTLETIDHFVKQTHHTLYLKLYLGNAERLSVHFAEKAEKAVRFLRH